MLRTSIAHRAIIASILSCVTVLPHFALGEEPGERQQFFAFDNGVGRDAGWSPEQQADLLAKLGYDGIGYTGVRDLKRRFAACDAAGVRIVSLYIVCWPERAEPFDPPLSEDELALLRGRNVVLWTVIQGQTTDDQAASVLSKFAAAVAPLGVKIAIYPHYSCYVETAQHALRIANLINCDNVGVSINLCHEMRSGNMDELTTIVKKTAGRLILVSINGADRVSDGEFGKGWARLIKPLDEGDFSVSEFVQSLSDAGYAGPIGLQCFKVPGDIRANLDRSIKAWNAMRPTTDNPGR